MKTELAGCPKIEISLLEDPPPLGVAPPMKAKPIIMRAAAAPLPDFVRVNLPAAVDEFKLPCSSSCADAEDGREP